VKTGQTQTTAKGLKGPMSVQGAVVETLIFGCAYERIADNTCSTSTLRRSLLDFSERSMLCPNSYRLLHRNNLIDAIQKPGRRLLGYRSESVGQNRLISFP
jgi:hypothetical protein